jgi:uncharacterized metal-binding protein
METSMRAAHAARTIIVVDGCGMNCGRMIVESAGFKVDDQVIVTELGVVKTMDLRLRQEEVEKVREAIVLKCSTR